MQRGKKGLNKTNVLIDGKPSKVGERKHLSVKELKYLAVDILRMYEVKHDIKSCESGIKL